jgi:dihydroorotase-like cyclic amidohydrolase
MIRIKNGYITTKQDERKRVTIYIDKEKIKAIVSGNDTAIHCDSEIDAEDNIIFSGFLDPHVHFDDPGFTEREDFETGTRSSAAGGITTIADMPCTSIPPVTTGKNFDNKLHIVQPKAYVDFSFWGGVTPEQVESNEYKKTLKELKEKGIIGVKFYTISGMELYPKMPVPDMDKAFRELKTLNLICAVHAEDFDLVHYYSELMKKMGRTDIRSWFEGRVYQAEPKAIWSLIGITEKVKNKLHIVHISTKEGLNIVKWGKQHNLDKLRHLSAERKTKKPYGKDYKMAQLILSQLIMRQENTRKRNLQTIYGKIMQEYRALSLWFR